MNKLIILDGPSCSGKTSTAREMQELLLPEIWFSVSIDTIIYALPNSVLEKCNKNNDWSLVNNDIIYSSSFNLVGSMLEKGANVIFDIVISTPKRAMELNKALFDFEKKTIAFTCELGELEKRLKVRGDRSFEEVFHSYNTSPKQLEYDVQLDTTNISPIEAARKIMSLI